MDISGGQELIMTLGMECRTEGHADYIWICVENKRSVQDVWYAKVVIDELI